MVIKKFSFSSIFSERNKYGKHEGGGYYEDKPRRGDGGGRKHNPNRRGETLRNNFLNKSKIERDDYGNAGFKQRNIHFTRSEGVQNPQIEPDNKFFKGHDLKATEPTIKFVNCNIIYKFLC